jgi:PEP-CTERM motif-containing protein
MRALGAVMALSCAVILAPSYAYADSVGMHVARIACGLDIDGVDQRGDRTDRDSVAALNSDGQASIDEHSPEVSDSRSDDDGDSGPSINAGHGNADDATFDERGGLENSGHFANQGSPQVFPDDRASFGDQIGHDGFGLDLARNITSALRNNEGNLERALAPGGGVVLVPQADPGPTPNPEPATMLLIGTGLAGLFRYRRQLLS